MSRLSISAVILSAMLFLTSCGAINGFLAALGFDTYDYESEEVIAVLERDDEIVSELASMVSILVINTPYLTPFDGLGEALPIYRDAILNYMLGREYAKYTGNAELIGKAAQKYPQLSVTSAIPVSDFEATVYRYFGGSEKVSHGDGVYFAYLDRVNAYTALTSVKTETCETVVTSCEETEHTYRITFYNKMGGKSSPEYRALIIKRDDGTLYFKSVGDK